MANEPLLQIRKAMEERGISALIVPTSDYHDTEYVCDHFGARAWISGFTGSAGTLVVLLDKAGLWTDGRYFIQAAAQLKDSGIDLMKMGEADTPSIPDYIIENLKPGQTAAFDGRCVSAKDAKAWSAAFEAHGLKVETETDFPGLVWENRPELPATRTFHYETKYAGKSVEEKLAQVRKEMEKLGADAHVTSKVDEIAWLLNLRANDIPSFPVALAYALITKDGGKLYIDSSRLDETSKALFEKNNIELRPYDAVYEDIKTVDGKVLMDETMINCSIAKNAKEPLFAPNPIVLLKACKNPVEVEGAREAHVKDGAAVCKFWYWLEKTLPQKTVTETEAAGKLHEFRAQQPDFLEDSFTTIPAYGANAAMPHYHADAAHPVEIKPEGLFLVDSGGQYLQGTTDITRTFVVGDLTEKEKHAFTRVLQGHIDLANAKFPHGARGMNLDILARRWLWNEGIDYNHGTGHGVGALSNVHEAPNGFRWKVVPERNDSCVLEEGMITSNEPGLYFEGEFGIRHENLTVVRKEKTTPFGDFYGLETITFVPFDVRGLDLSLMDKSQIDWLNSYHKEVFEKISPLLNEEETLWLKEKTAPVTAE
jgi:Xaa-Pro aminopeptidase